jgi:hypothetical protein
MSLAIKRKARKLRHTLAQGGLLVIGGVLMLGYLFLCGISAIVAAFSGADGDCAK